MTDTEERVALGWFFRQGKYNLITIPFFIVLLGGLVCAAFVGVVGYWKSGVMILDCWGGPAFYAFLVLGGLVLAWAYFAYCKAIFRAMPKIWDAEAIPLSKKVFQSGVYILIIPSVLLSCAGLMKIVDCGRGPYYLH